MGPTRPSRPLASASDAGSERFTAERSEAAFLIHIFAMSGAEGTRIGKRW